MKTSKLIKISIVVIFIIQFAQFAFAANGIEVSWSANSESDLAGYKVYYGTSSEDYQNSLDVGNFTSAEIDNLNAGVTYYVAVTAYDSEGNESDFSEEVQATIPDESGSVLGPGSDSGGGSGGGGCFISASSCEHPAFSGATLMMLACMAIVGILGLSRK